MATAHLGITNVEPTAVPRAARELLSRPWLEIDAPALWEYHNEKNQRDGLGWYILGKRSGASGPFRAREAIALATAGVIPARLVRDHGDNVAINQHASHSVQQFLHECGVAYARHVERMNNWEPRIWIAP